jgi:hypothetical protein
VPVGGGRHADQRSLEIAGDAAGLGVHARWSLSGGGPLTSNLKAST